MKNLIILTSTVAGILLSGQVRADCTNCVGDYASTKTSADLSGGTTHTHDFGTLCDATDLAGYTKEVSITIRAVADLNGSTRYVTADFVSGTETTPITSGNGFVGAPSDGKFFKDDGQTDCPGPEHQGTVYLDYDEFNALLEAGDDTVTIKVTASQDVEDLCDLCCEGGHSWTPDQCCGELIPCSCPPNVQTYSEVVLIYLDCDVIGPSMECDDDGDCTDDGLWCNGDEVCQDGACVSEGSPCLGTPLVCDEDANECVTCDLAPISCEDEDGLWCNGQSYCDEQQSPPVCVAGTPPCDPQECFEDIDACFACTAP